MAIKNRAEYQQLLAREFLNCLEEKGLDWKRGWDAPATAPQNAVTHAPYHGINRFHLSLLAVSRGYADPRWATMTQIMDKNGTYHPGETWHLQKGSRAVYVEYWYAWDPQEKTALPWSEYKRLTLEEQAAYQLRARYTPVFHASMIDGIAPIQLPERDPRQVSRMVYHTYKGMGVAVSFDGGSRAFYVPSEDAIHLPSAELFHDSYGLDSVLLHELAHASGHHSRLDRPQEGRFGSPEYAYEELVAEIGSCFVAAGLEQTPLHVENHKAYVQAWIRDIRDKPETLVAAVRDAQAAANYMERQAELSMERERQAETGLEAAEEARAEARDEAQPQPPAAAQPQPEPQPFAGWAFDGGSVAARDGLLLVAFQEKPDEATRGALRQEGFHWSRKAQAWQHRLDDAALAAARRITSALQAPAPDRTAPAAPERQSKAPAPPQERPWSPVTKSGKPRYTEEQYQTARGASALEYARQQGYHLVRESGRYHLKEHDSMIFLPDGRWHWNSRGLHGGAIEFIMEYEGRTLPEAVLTLNGVDWSQWDRSQRDTPRPERKPAPYAPTQADLREARTKKEFVLPPRADKMTRAFSYLCSTRGLDYDLVRTLVRDHRVYESVNRLPDGTELHNAAFVGFDRDGTPRSAFLRGCSQASSFKMEQPGSDKSWPFIIPGRPDAGTLYVFEAAIDAASHATIHKLAGLDWQDAHRASLGGSAPGEAIWNALAACPSEPAVCICTDQDSAGQAHFEKLRDDLTTRGFGLRSIRRSRVPVGKDWNEYLQTWRKTVERHRELPTTEFAGDAPGEVCGRIHYLAPDGSVTRTVAYTDPRHFRNAAARQMRDAIPCVTETPAQLRELERAVRRRQERQAAKEQAQSPPPEKGAERPEPEPPAGAAQRPSLAEQLASAVREAALRNQARQAQFTMPAPELGAS